MRIYKIENSCSLKTNKVKFTCGFNNTIKEMVQDGCDYYLAFQTPAACKQSVLDQMHKESSE